MNVMSGRRWQAGSSLREADVLRSPENTVKNLKLVTELIHVFSIQLFQFSGDLKTLAPRGGCFLITECENRIR